jgi:general secretion pathway protein N
MKKAFRIAAVALIAFIVILLARFPAKWVKPLLPENVSCDQVAGTLWNGVCLGLVARGAAAGDIKWDLHPLKLFTGKLGLQIEWSRGTASARGDVDLGLGNSIAARDLVANLPLDSNLLPWVPPNLRGAVNANLTALQIKGRAITAVQGTLDARGIANGGTSFGDYRVTFPAGQGDTPPTGALVDTGNGPLRVAATLKLTAEPGYEVEGRVAAKPGAPPGLSRQIEFLGSPDPQGMRPFSFAGSY